MPTRRAFLQLASAGLAAAPFAGWPSLRPARTVDGFTELRRGVGTFTARGGTIGWLVRDDAVVLVDAQFPETARQCWAGLQERTDQPLNVLINTHHHGDHTAGNAALAEHARHIVAHANVPALQRQAAGDAADAQVVADLTFDTALTLQRADETLRLTHNGPAHTGGDTAIHLEEANVAHVGDLVFNRVYPFIDIDGGASTEGWIDTLETLHGRFDDDTIVIHGHGAPDAGITGGRADLLQMRDFLTALRDFVRAAMAAGETVDDIAATDVIPGFEAYNRDDWPLPLERCIRAVHRELQGA
jgi:glyoxylase-like metal-dependent hydrolase (beta-lactamase superfamily II)